MIPLDPAIQFRHELHTHPELSGREAGTAARLAERLREAGAAVHTGLGGHGLLGLFQAEEPGPTILLRAELDALPIEESLEIPHASESPGVAHKCGHDGHMAILDAVARQLAETPPRQGTVALLFQPAEESGLGAAAVLDDASWDWSSVDVAYALHNVPGRACGAILSRPGPVALASRGLEVQWRGREAHAAHPEEGRSPMRACLATALAWSEKAAEHQDAEGGRITVVHAGVGQRSAFGTAPGTALLQATLRAADEERVDELETALRDRVVDEEGLQVEIHVRDPFPATVNDPDAVARVVRAAAAAGLDYEELEAPYPWSEDFGHFLERFPGALFGLGAGLEQPPLHDPAYDFPDAALRPGIDLFLALLREHLGLDEDSSR